MYHMDEDYSGDASGSLLPYGWEQDPVSESEPDAHKDAQSSLNVETRDDLVPMSSSQRTGIRTLASGAGGDAFSAEVRHSPPRNVLQKPLDRITCKQVPSSCKGHSPHFFSVSTPLVFATGTAGGERTTARRERKLLVALLKTSVQTCLWEARASAARCECAVVEMMARLRVTLLCVSTRVRTWMMWGADTPESLSRPPCADQRDTGALYSRVSGVGMGFADVADDKVSIDGSAPYSDLASIVCLSPPVSSQRAPVSFAKAQLSACLL
ncbi:hypothetical protein C8R43DRAFT_1118175 [Mycena crocata]|nr:hypothetical protein C8R43DRAFT_1118175 [Mycena crocata]